jgi:hypothetical protein
MEKTLTGIFDGGWGDDFGSAWDAAMPAPEYEPLPRGSYECLLCEGGPITARTGSRGYRLVFTVVEGEHSGRKVFHTCWLTEKAVPSTKRDLAKLGIERAGQLGQPLPNAFKCKVLVALQREDDGTERNRVVRFDVISVEPDPFNDPDFPVGEDDHSAEVGK